LQLNQCYSLLSCRLVVRDSPPPPSALRALCPVCYVSFCYCLLLSFSFFPGEGRSVQGAMLIWPRVVCGSTVCSLVHLVLCVFPRGLGAGIWQRGSPLVSPFNVKWECYTRAGSLEESKFCLFSVFFPVKCICSVSPRFYFRKLSASSL
jgi:hypothetical protein